MLAVFAACAVLMAARLLPALLAVPLMALAIAALAGAGPAGLALVVTHGSSLLAGVIVTAVFGALLSRVTIATGVAETIVDYAAEFGGDAPVWLALALAAVVALLFSSLFGLGAIIMVGSIVLPIMLTVGVPRTTAATLFMLAYALGFIFNITQWKFYTDTFHVARAQLLPFAYVLAAVDAAALIAFVIVDFRRTRGYATWALQPAEPVLRKHAPPLALLAPVLPLVLYYVLGVEPVVGLALSAVYAAIAARPSKAVETLVSSAIRGVEDVAPAVLLFIGIGMLLAATSLPEARAALAPVVGAIAPRSAFAYVVLFGVLSPLALYRGPLNLYGVGIGVYTVLASLGVLRPELLVAAAMAVVQVQNACDPTNTQNVWVANFTGVRVDALLRAMLPYQAAVAVVATICAAAFAPALFGIPPLPAFAPAAAATLAPAAAPAGLFAPASAARVIAIVHAGDEQSTRLADEVAHQIERGWSGYRTVAPTGDPSSADCVAKPYVAVLRTVAADGDAGLYLADCAGWPVEEWHAAESTPAIGQDAPVGRALSLLVRLRTWMLENPRLAAALFEHGVAYDRGGVPTFFYSLVKTSDGQLRAIVRPGGPAYAAGLRTNDIVQKIDGRFWWEYGTYPSQRRAYDGLPHAFVVTRDGHDLEVHLSAPFDGV